MIDRSANVGRALRERQRGFLLNPYRFAAPGGGGGGAPTVWNDADKQLVGSYALSDADKTAAVISSSAVVIRSTGAADKVAGKHYFEILRSGSSGSSFSFRAGVITSGAALWNPGSGTPSQECLFYFRGDVFTEGASNRYFGPFNACDTGHVTGFAIDVGTGFSIYIDGVFQFSGPYTRTGLQICYWTDGGIGGAGATIRTSASECAYSPPSGYSNWD